MVHAQLLVKNTADIELMRVTSEGKLGLGYKSPDYKMDVNGNISGACTPRYKDDSLYGTRDGGAF